MIANSTNISNRLFRTQKYVTIAVASVLVLFLVVLSISSHEQIKNHEIVKLTFGKVNGYFNDIESNYDDDKNMLESDVELDNVDEALEKQDSSGVTDQRLKDELNALIDE